MSCFKFDKLHICQTWGHGRDVTSGPSRPVIGFAHTPPRGLFGRRLVVGAVAEETIQYRKNSAWKSFGWRLPELKKFKNWTFNYSAIRLMYHLIMVQFCYWFKFRLVLNGMTNLLCKNIWLKVQNNLHNGSNWQCKVSSVLLSAGFGMQTVTNQMCWCIVRLHNSYSQ